jgi:DNA-binding XRE family transcriptional regulator
MSISDLRSGGGEQRRSPGNGDLNEEGEGMKLRGLRQARQRSGLSLGQLAELTGLRRETIAQLEHGRSEPQPYMVHRLAAALDTSSDGLLGVESTYVGSVSDRPEFTPAG